MNVGIVISHNYPTDREVRTRKIAKSLNENGDNVYIFCRNTPSDPAKGKINSDLELETESLDYAQVLRFSWFKNTPILNAVTATLPFNPFWILWLVITLWKENIDVTVATNLRAGPNGIIASKLLDLPVIIDLRENHAELAKRLPKKTVFNHITHHPRIISWLEWFIYKFSDEIWVVADERRDVMPEWVAKSGRISVVSNFPHLQELEEFSTLATDTSFEWPGITLVYVGVLNDFRGLDLILRTLAGPNITDDVTIAIAGEGPHRSALEATVHDLEIEDRVFFEGWIDTENVPKFLESGDIGVIPHEVNGFTNTTVPNKLFDMMAAGLPIIATNMKPVERVVCNAGCGRVIPPDETSVAEAIEELRAMDDLHQLGQNGREAIQQSYNWKKASETVISSVHRVGVKT